MELEAPIPVLQATQLMSLAFVFGAKGARLGQNIVDPRPVLGVKDLLNQKRPLTVTMSTKSYSGEWLSRSGRKTFEIPCYIISIEREVIRRGPDGNRTIGQ